MERRRVLTVLGSAGLVGLIGCSSPGESGETEPMTDAGETEPLTDAFPEDVEPEFWQVTRDGPGAVATGENLYALSQSSTDEGAQTRYRSTLSRITPTGEVTWPVDIEAATADIRAAGDTIYYFRGEGQFDRVTERVAAHETETSERSWLEGVKAHPTFVGATAKAVFVGSTSDDPYELPIRALEAADGQQRWREVTAMPRGGVVSHGLCLVHGHPDKVIALDAEMGERSWEKTVGTEQRPGGIDRLDVVADKMKQCPKCNEFHRQNDPPLCFGCAMGLNKGAA
jgi:hypothetical protein